jgi:nuclear pore complex protein Nup98-Nup96
MSLSTGGAFGTPQTNNTFGAKTGGFGTPATTTASLFGSGTATAGSTGGFGGFGASASATQSSPFGGSNTGGGLFGQNKTGFGANTTTSSNPFGGAATSSPFGSTGGAFGAPASSALAPSTGECQGTGSVPFQATVEKEPNSTSNQQNAFQSITFQAPYQKFSPEELRLADYQQGRKHGNASNQAGAFGSSTGFGGFGTNSQTTNTGFGATNTGSNLFGGTSSSPFGASQPATSGFGANTATSGGLFGAAKPATTNLFGAPAQNQPAGNLFGNTGSTGFGSAPSGFGTNNATTGSSLFGQSNTANKPPAFSFNTSQPASTGTTFGSTPAASGFGGGLFGNTQPQNTANPFGGQQQQQPAANNAFGSGGGFGTTQQNTGTSLFGNPKPATGLFGAPAATGSSLFSQPASNTNAFGGANTQNTGGLFGAQKPATTGTGLFGQTNNQTNTGGSNLFGGLGGQTQNQTQPQTNSLFGGLNNANQQKPSLFPQTQQQSGTSLFGGTGTQQQGTSLFGNPLLSNNQQQQQQPQQTNSLFGGSNSLLGNPQQNQQTSQSFTASINDPNAFGGASLFASLAQAQVQNPGPLATPISNGKPRRSVALPIYKLAPASSPRFSTPARRGFGFSYSNYNSPGSASSASSTPGGNLNNSLLGGTFGRGLSKSMSTSSLRRSFNMEDSILNPGAFSASPSARHYGSTGSMKKLVINRGIRSDLFSPPNSQSQPPSTPNGSILKKRVSFDASTVPGGITNGASSPLKQTQNNLTPRSENLGYERPRADLNGTTSPPEMEQVTGKELARVQEEDSPAPAGPPKPPAKPIPGQDMEPGEYWMKPTKEEIENMNRVQRQKVTGFTVGREGIGQVTFDAPVDLTTINLDELIDKTIILSVRSATVYGEPSKKPPMGKGLNVPSTITLFNSWPRKHGKGVRNSSREGIAKHIANLKKVPDTNFVDYEPATGTWIFKVDHFTTYKEYDDEDDTDGEDTSQFGQSTLSAPPDTPTPKSRTPKSQQFEQSFTSTSEGTHTESDPEDTFQFRKKKILPLPGAFDNQEVYADEEMADEYDDENQQSFLDERSVGSQSENGVEEPMDQDDVFEDDESVSIVDQEMAGSFPQADNTAELEEDYSQDVEDMDMVVDTPGAVVRARLRAAKNSGTPVKSGFAAGNDWASTLKTTISPQKQDRALLKSLIDIHGNDSRPDEEPTPVATRNRVVSDGRGFATSIDLMNSLFGQTRSPVKAKVPAEAKGFEVGAPSPI